MTESKETPNQLVERLRIKYAAALRLLEEQENKTDPECLLDMVLEVMDKSKQEYTVENFEKTTKRIQAEQKKLIESRTPLVLKQLNQEITKYITKLSNVNEN